MVRKYDEIDFLEAVLEIKRSKVSRKCRRALCTHAAGPCGNVALHLDTVSSLSHSYRK